MNHYEYRDSGVEWLGKIPEHWEVIPIKLLEGNSEAVVQTGPFGAQLHASDYQDEGVPLILIKHVNNLRISQNGLPKINKAKAERLSIYRIEAGDIVFSRVGSIGRIALASLEHSGWLISGQMLRMRIKNAGIHHQYAVYAIAADVTQRYFETSSVGSTRDSINTEILRNLPIPVPPLGEQQAIADFLDRKTGQIDRLIELKQRQVELLQEQRVALISEAVTRGLDPNAPMKDSGAEWLGEVPEHWEVFRIKTALNSIVNGVWGDEPNGDKNDLVCVRVADFDMRTLGISQEKLTLRNIPATKQKGRILAKGDLLIEKSGGGELSPVGRVIKVDLEDKAVCSNFIGKITVNKDRVFPDFLLYSLSDLYNKSISVRSIKQTTGIQNLDAEAYFNELMAFPPLDEQQTIASYLDSQTAKIDRLIALEQRQMELLREQRTTLISEAVTGKIDVRQAGLV